MRPAQGSAATVSHSTAAQAAMQSARAPAEVAEPSPAPAPRMPAVEVPSFLKTLDVQVHAPQRTAVVELEPVDLGKLSFELSLEPEGKVSAHVRAERPDGLAAMEARLPELRAALLERGFVSADVQLSLGLADQGSRRPGHEGRKRPAGPGSRTIAAAELQALMPVGEGAIDVWA